MILKIDCDVYLFYDSRVNETFCHLIEPQGTFTSLGLKKKTTKRNWRHIITSMTDTKTVKRTRG
jgi:hypothetical protein